MIDGLWVLTHGLYTNLGKINRKKMCLHFLNLILVMKAWHFSFTELKMYQTHSYRSSSRPSPQAVPAVARRSSLEGKENQELGEGSSQSTCGQSSSLLHCSVSSSSGSGSSLNASQVDLEQLFFFVSATIQERLSISYHFMPETNSSGFQFGIYAQKRWTLLMLVMVKVQNQSIW